MIEIHLYTAAELLSVRDDSSAERVVSRVENERRWWGKRCPRVTVSKDGISIRVDQSGSYFIDCGRIQDHAALVNWIEHLRDKEWFGPVTEGAFLRTVAEAWRKWGVVESTFEDRLQGLVEDAT